MAKKWTDEELKILKANCDKRPGEVGKLIGRSAASIRMKRRELAGILPATPATDWVLQDETGAYTKKWDATKRTNDIARTRHFESANMAHAYLANLVSADGLHVQEVIINA